MDVLELALRIAVSATFLLSAAGKTVTPAPSAEMVAQLLALRGRRLARVLAAALIGAEAAAAALVASADSGIRADLAAGIALALCALFTAAAIRARASGRQIACRCFGSLRPTEMLGPRTLRRALPLAAAVVAWYAAVQEASFTAVRVPDRTALTAAAGALVATVLAWTHWRRGIPHRRFANEAIRKETTGPSEARRRALNGGMMP